MILCITFQAMDETTIRWPAGHVYMPEGPELPPLLERHELMEAIFADVNAHLADKGITLRSGTLADATIIDAPSSTKNKADARNPEMSSTKKGNHRYFGMKAHFGVNVDSSLTHSLETSTAKLRDSQVWDAAPHGAATSVLAELPLERHWSVS